jgi:predicted acylesterase/phospholipase RssA
MEDKNNKEKVRKTQTQATSTSKNSLRKVPPRKLVKILSIDGGGIRGIIPAFILQELEKKLKHEKQLSQCFDVMSGTSTGGIIVLLLNTPDSNGKPKYRASDVLSLYQDLGSIIFQQSWQHCLTTLNGWICPKYSSDALKKNLEKLYGDCRLQDALTNIIIPAYDISKDDTVFFKSDKAKLNPSRDFYFKDIGQSTSAAPTYFKPAQIQDIFQQTKYTLIDGGVSVNNPTMSACVHAVKLFGRDCDFLVVSLGTGTNNPVTPGKLSFHGKEIKWGGRLEWAPDILPVLMNAPNEVVDYQMNEIFNGGEGTRKYHRFQVSLDTAHTTLDNTSPGNILALEKYAQDIIRVKQEELKEIAHLLDSED